MQASGAHFDEGADRRLPSLAPPSVAVGSVALFCGTAASVGGGDWMALVNSPAVYFGLNPVLFALGSALGAAVVKNLFERKAPMLTASWLVGWAGFWVLVCRVAIRTDRDSGPAGWLGLFFAVPLGLTFGFVLMRLTETLAKRLEGLARAGDRAGIDAESARWLLGAAMVKWLTQPVVVLSPFREGLSLASVSLGLSVFVAGCVAAWLSWRAGRTRMLSLAGMLVVVAVGVNLASMGKAYGYLWRNLGALALVVLTSPFNASSFVPVVCGCFFLLAMGTFALVWYLIKSSAARRANAQRSRLQHPPGEWVAPAAPTTGPSMATARAPISDTPPSTAVVVVGLFCGTATTLSGREKMLVFANPALFLLGFAIGARLVRDLFHGKAPRFELWVLGWAAYWLLPVYVFFDDPEKRGGAVVLTLILGPPFGLVFGLALLNLTRALARRLQTVWMVSGSAAKVGGEGAAWLVAIGAVKWATEPLSLWGMSAVVAAGAAVWLADRGARPLAVVFAGALLTCELALKL